MEWQIVLREEGKPDDVRVMSADNIDPSALLHIDGRDWKHSGDEETGNPAVPIRVFFEPAA